MIIAFIYSIHLLFVLFIFTKKWQNESLADAFNNMLLIIILFFVGWPLITMVLKIFIDVKGFGIHFDRDTIILTILSIGEYMFYKMYYKEELTIEAGKGK